MIDFNRPAFTGREFDYIRDAVQRGMENIRKDVLSG